MRSGEPVPDSFRERLLSQAHSRGFALAGIAPATPADHFDQFERWLDRGFHGEMDYLAKKREKRQHPSSILSNVRSVLMVGLEYGTTVPDPSASGEVNSGRVARYAQGPDYHRLMWDRLNELGEWIRTERPGSRTEMVTDTAPLLERDFARRAGLGWVGKNTMLINSRRGSFFFLGALLMDFELAASKTYEKNHCGTCTACLDACPTQAFPEPGVLDATRCISYLTIELRSSIPLELRTQMGHWLFGCDVCQDVCPWNRFTQPGAFPNDPTLESLDCIRILRMTDEQFRLWFRGSSFFRTKRSGLVRNACIVLGNTGDATALPALERATTDEDPVIRESAHWAMAEIRGRMEKVGKHSPYSDENIMP
ncbi:MAG: tRNA epoxyqueuosine(34) reductase QueG [Gemmataceae bacterium]